MKDRADGGHTVGVGDGFVARGEEFVLITYALGSCVGITAWDPLARVGGMLHSQLPVSYGYADRAATTPFLFTDTGVTELLRQVFALGADKRRLVVKLAGCAMRAETDTRFRVGQRNLAVARRVLWKNDIVVDAEDVGGDAPRTMTLDLATGITSVRSRGENVVL